MSLKGFQKAAVRVRIEHGYIGLTRVGSTILIRSYLLGTPNLQAEIQHCAYSHTDYARRNISLRLTLSRQGEHTKDAVYIDSERRFQELEKACHSHRITVFRARLIDIREYRRRRNYTRNQKSKLIWLPTYME